MLTVDYKYDIDQTVYTPFGDTGIVVMLGYDDGGKKYYVQTATESQWFKEDQINMSVKD